MPPAFSDAGTLLAGLRRWVEIDTPTGDEDGMARLQDLIEADFTALGAACRRVPGRNGLGGHLTVKLPGGVGTPLLIVAHLDTVCQPGSVPIRLDGDRFYGPGAADMKGGGFLAYAALARIVTETGTLPRPVTLIFNGDEEIGSPTSRDLICAAAREAACVLVPEPARADEVITVRKGRAKYLVSVEGRAAHAGSAFADGRNAVLELAWHVLALAALSDPGLGTTVNIGTFRGGSEANVVAESAEAWIDVRFASEAEGDRVERHLRALVPSSSDFALRVDGAIEKPPLRCEEGPGSLFAQAKEIARALGIDLAAQHSGGGSDGNFTAATGTPTLDGLGAIGNDWHSPREHVLVSCLPRREALLRHLIAELR